MSHLIDLTSTGSPTPSGEEETNKEITQIKGVGETINISSGSGSSVEENEEIINVSSETNGELINVSSESNGEGEIINVSSGSGSSGGVEEENELGCLVSATQSPTLQESVEVEVITVQPMSPVDLGVWQDPEHQARMRQDLCRILEISPEVNPEVGSEVSLEISPEVSLEVCPKVSPEKEKKTNKEYIEDEDEGEEKDKTILTPESQDMTIDKQDSDRKTKDKMNISDEGDQDKVDEDESDKDKQDKMKMDKKTSGCESDLIVMADVQARVLTGANREPAGEGPAGGVRGPPGPPGPLHHVHLGRHWIRPGHHRDSSIRQTYGPDLVFMPWGQEGDSRVHYVPLSREHWNIMVPVGRCYWLVRPYLGHHLHLVTETGFTYCSMGGAINTRDISIYGGMEELGEGAAENMNQELGEEEGENINQGQEIGEGAENINQELEGVEEDINYPGLGEAEVIIDEENMNMELEEGGGLNESQMEEGGGEN